MRIQLSALAHTLGTVLTFNLLLFISSATFAQVPIERSSSTRTLSDASWTTIIDFRPDRESAYDACLSFAAALGYDGNSYCINSGAESFSGVSTSEMIWAGNLRDQNVPPPQVNFYIQYVIFPYYYIAEDLDICEGKCPPAEGNPIDPVTGRKYEIEQDYLSPVGALSFVRSYSSWASSDGNRDMGFHWRHNYSASMGQSNAEVVEIIPRRQIRGTEASTKQTACESGWPAIATRAYRGLYATATASYTDGKCVISDTSGNTRTIPLYPNFNVGGTPSGDTRKVTRENGMTYLFIEQGGVWVERNGYPVSLIENTSSWTFFGEDQVEDTFVDGVLVSREYPSGELLTLEYTDDELVRVLSNYGRELTFAYLDGQLDQVTTPSGVVQFGYADGNLTTVTYPDQSTRSYLYEDPDLPSHLTGILDENGFRFATWAYDSDGRGILSEHANGAERVQFSYGSNATTTVTDSQGAVRTYGIGLSNGTVSVTNITGERCATCALNQFTQISRDANGFISSGTDWNGNTTSYTRNDRGLVLTKTEGVGTADERVTTTQWHPDYRLPTRITYPDRVVDFVYDADGNLLSRTEAPNAP